jgi:hypothetical protein
MVSIYALLIYSMESIIEKDNIICGLCGLKFERGNEFKYCSNCFACTGCEIYYCPDCDNEIVITPVRSIAIRSDQPDGTNQASG